MRTIKLVTNSMLGKLTRWLRLAGYDVTYVGDFKTSPEEQNDALVERARIERRVLLTRDLTLHHRARRLGAKSVFIKSGDVIEQLAEVSRYCGERIRIDPKNSRCPACNGTLKSADRREVEMKIPSTVIKKHDRFWMCKSCGKVYWEGKHWKTITEMASHYYRIVDRE